MSITELKKHLMAGGAKTQQIDFFEFAEEFVSSVKVFPSGT